MRHTHHPVTIKEVAKEAGVSIATVSRVLNQHTSVTSETKECVLRVMKELGYNRNEVARSLKMRHTNTIGIVAPKLSNVYFMEVIESMDQLLTPLGYTMVISCSYDSVSEEQKKIQVLLDRNVDALVVIPAGFQGHHFNSRALSRVPMVMVDRYIEGVKADAVLVDNRLGVQQMVRALHNEGFTRIGYIGGDNDILTANERYAGYLQTMKDLDLPIEKEFIYLQGTMTIRDGHTAMDRFLTYDNHPKAYLIANDLLHLGVTSHLIEHVASERQHQYVLASFDYLSYSPLLSFCHYAMRQPQEIIGSEVVRLLQKRMKGETKDAYEKVVVTPELKIITANGGKL
ncbi:MAG: LacI family DNA-binding transcriptional regulator [Sphaerochaetaceae bacterium]|nr:LacI family DNA-binding transcriptional regulator [Sphaerochaetaceae bacterium]